MGIGDSLPRGWTTVVLREVVSLSRERIEPSSAPDSPYLGLEHIEPHTGKILGKAIARDMRSVSNRFRAGDVLYGKLRPYLNKVCIPDFDGLCSAELLVLTTVKALNPRFLRYWISQPEFVRFATQNAAGINLPRISFGVLAEYPIALPPISEQHRIAEQVDGLMLRGQAARANIDSAIPLLERLRQSILAAAFRGDLTADPRSVLSNDGERELLSGIRTRELRGALPNGWRWVTLDDLCWDAGYGTSAKCAYDGNGPAVLRIPNVHQGRLSTVDLKYVVDPANVSDELTIAPGDLLLVRTNGSRSLIGRAAVVREAYDKPHLFASYLIRLRLIGTGPSWAWVQLMMQAPQMRRVLEQKAASSAGQFNLSLSKLLPIRLPLPPSGELPRLVAKLESMLAVTSSVGHAIHGQLGSVSEVEDAILSKALHGELVPQDPNDEPASVLLERIRTERAGEGASRPRRGRRLART
ncbi:MAG TPA: restriction endonuclease subunit S [Longimicrobium sp.]|jgi:type I restriction enzyme S subunit|nr:restriction endonuclease subunit S [Longimicrobium sp.]